jgi:metal-responsive CopG/Arc/MetJ family transcriptional regulator
MANVKTAISIQKTLFERAESLAKEMQVSRSRIFALALEAYLRQYQDRQLFDAINQACEEAPLDQAEREHLRKLHRLQRSLVEGQW